MENQEELQKEILTWAARAGQELVTIEICRAGSVRDAMMS